MNEFYVYFELWPGPIGRLFYIDYMKTRQVRSFILGVCRVPRGLLSVAVEIKGIEVTFDTVSVCLGIFLIH